MPLESSLVLLSTEVAALFSHLLLVLSISVSVSVSSS